MKTPQLIRQQMASADFFFRGGQTRKGGRGRGPQVSPGRWFFGKGGRRPQVFRSRCNAKPSLPVDIHTHRLDDSIVPIPIAICIWRAIATKENEVRTCLVSHHIARKDSDFDFETAARRSV
eukprot:CAMPEP_0178997042 /NCGR_PEP_ID=MMETSP0795-20121207/8711_1 /TAXON_ID=88552 /ORGANISM="Amoebophrya sp., Strain Ameob2" /LENGTH=120 /DNA_ID=CAMNT_0020689513 /DNA_START=503 /DNA_END=865 /DNA_ORIENTATION=-